MCTITTLCGSTKFRKEFEQSNAYLTLQGNIVLSVGFFEQDESINLTKKQVKQFQILHNKKIDLCNELFIVNPGSYIGESTEREVNYGKELGKKIRYYTDYEQQINTVLQALKTQ